MSRYVVNIPNSVYNDVFLPFKHDYTRYLIFYGGAGSGKSYSIAQILIERMLKDEKFNCLVVRKVARTNRDSTFALLNQIINRYGIRKLVDINNTEMRISCLNGNEIAFAGLDDTEKLKSITFKTGEATTVWVEEASEILENDLKQLNLRLRGGKSKKQIILSFNPIDINHWLKTKLIDSNRSNIKVLHTTYKDNRFLDIEYIQELESYRDSDPYYYSVYCLGQWGVLGETVFDAKAVSVRMQVIKPAIKQGYFIYDDKVTSLDNRQFIENDKGEIKIYIEPEKNKQYAIGADTAGDGSDYNVAQVIDYDTGVQVATMRMKKDIDLFTRQLYCLGYYYNYALIGVEANFDTFPIRLLEQMSYYNQFVREQQDTFTGAIKKAYGFRTDSLSRPRIISQLIEIVREHTYLFNDKQTLQEMLTFVRNEKGRPEAQAGAYDDCVMAMAITHEIKKQIIPKVVIEKVDSYEYEIFNYGMD